MKRTLWPAVVLLLLVQVGMALTIVHRESLTFDEDDHMFAGYMMWKAHDYGLNPEHPPLVKLVAAVPILHEPMWVPPPRQGFFKDVAYGSGRDWLARNDGASQRLVFRMRASAELVAVGLCLAVFVAARAWFGEVAGILALVLVVFDPNVLANSALVTTDVGVSCFFVAAVFAFYRYAIKPSATRLCIAGVASGLLLATKHSGILLAPMLLLLMGWEVFAAGRGERKRTALRMGGALVAITCIAVVVLWSFYGFRYAARPAGLELTPSLASYVQPLGAFQSGAVLTLARLHILPESYLMGLVDVKLMALGYPTFLLGKVYPHGVWNYFPLAILIKTTLGLLALVLVAAVLAAKGRMPERRSLVYVLVPPVAYLTIAMAAGMDIGARHLLPMYAFLAIFAAAGAAALARTGRTGAVVCALLVGAHVASSLFVFPNEIAYANEAVGGPNNVHNLLSDANVDWAQQLYQVKAWGDRHPAEECWFAYFARPEIDPGTYGIRCHALPTLDTSWMGGTEAVPPVVHGAVLISAGDLSGCEWPSGKLNPYRSFQKQTPAESIDHGVFVYEGTIQVPDAAAVSAAQLSAAALKQKQPAEALRLAQQAVSYAPGNLLAEQTLGDAAAAAGNMQEATAAWRAALALAQQLEPDAQPSYVPDLESKLHQASAPQ